LATFASFDGTEIFYSSEGYGSAVLLIHGSFTDSERSWVARGITAELQARGHQVVMMDCRGHGRSAKPHDPVAYAGDTMANDARALLDHLDLQAVQVVGYSMGSRVAARLAVLDQRVHSLVLGGCGDADAGGPVAGTFAEVLEAEDTGQLDAGSRMMRDQLDHYGADRVAMAALCRAYASGEERMVITGIKVPTLFLTGIDDRLPGEVAPLVDGVPGSQWVQVPGDHFTALDDPGFLSAIVEFLDQ
jgi:pimeloyl-ACP methyl ester carboxylesterase